jgi:hypothetical protein
VDLGGDSQAVAALLTMIDGRRDGLDNGRARLNHVSGRGVDSRQRPTLLTHVNGRRDGLDNGRAGNKALGLTLVDRLGVAR